MFQKGRGQTILIEHLFLSQESERSFGCKEKRQTRSQQERIMDFHYFFLAPIIFTVAILGWTERAKYRILQEEQKTITAPF